MKKINCALVLLFVVMCFACTNGPPQEVHQFVVKEKHLVPYVNDEIDGNEPAILVVGDGQQEYSFKYWPQDLGFNSKRKTRREDSVDFFMSIKVGHEYWFYLEHGELKKVQDMGEAK